MMEEREKTNYIKPNSNGIVVRTVSYLRRYCRHVPNFLRFRTTDEGLFLCLVCQMC